MKLTIDFCHFYKFESLSALFNNVHTVAERLWLSYLSREDGGSSPGVVKRLFIFRIVESKG